MATEKSITSVSALSNEANNLSQYYFTMSNSSGTAARLPGGKFANIVMGSGNQTGIKIWVGTSSNLPSSSNRDSNTLYFVTD
jgi:hypothetical protein